MTLDEIETSLDADRIAPRAALRLCRRARRQLEANRTVRAVAERLGLPRSEVAEIERRALWKISKAWRYDAENRCLYRAVTSITRPGLRRTVAPVSAERRSEVARIAAGARWRRPGLAKA